MTFKIPMLTLPFEEENVYLTAIVAESNGWGLQQTSDIPAMADDTKIRLGNPGASISS